MQHLCNSTPLLIYGDTVYGLQAHTLHLCSHGLLRGLAWSKMVFLTENLGITTVQIFTGMLFSMMGTQHSSSKQRNDKLQLVTIRLID